MDSAPNIIGNNVCRICFQIQYNTISLYSDKDGSSPYEKLVNNTKLNIAINDGGPNVICGQCFIEMNIFMEFLTKCERANKLLLQYKENNSVDDAEYVYEGQEKLFENDCTEERVVSDNKTSESSESNTPISTIKDNATQSMIKHCCQYCSKVFTRKFNLKLHLARHSGAAPRPRPRPRRACPAPACGKSFTSLTNLNTHIRRHNGERPYECPECGKAFRSSTTLNDHKRIHTGVKPYMCPTCGKRFTTNKLSVHMRTHAPRPHACGACPRRFVEARALREHAAREHAGGAAGGGPGLAAAPAREHACALCSARYNHKQSLNKHLRKRHGVKTSAVVTKQQTGFS
ncbi:zinc finger protein 135-like [Vanessa atalanta]|uniref:zinc finger protein 135-like n=1 Tax=Vanessa atalanta TaxID=42275 RepID=UPI001FCE219C|nr:zinc finger protein 135-like [Vanessa atalanta]